VDIITLCYDFIRARPPRKSRDLQTSNTEVCPTNVLSSHQQSSHVAMTLFGHDMPRKSRDLQTSNTEVCHAQGDE
jgi:hypothetical protein